MIEKSVNKHKLGAVDEQKSDLLFWLSKTPAERVAAVDFLRAQHADTSKGIQKVVFRRRLGAAEIGSDIELLESVVEKKAKK